MDGGDTSAVPLALTGDEETPPAAGRGRLLRKYAVLLISLVGIALLLNSGFDSWFSYQENKSALIRVQQEKAAAAAQRIENFIAEIERQIGWTTQALWALGSLDQRRFDYVRLLHQVPAITELSQLDSVGRERLKVSRLSVDLVDSSADLSQSPAFVGAKTKGVWFSPVYFRKQSEPYMTLAVRHAGRNGGVTVAEINLKLLFDVITAMKIGAGGYAYVVDGSGKLIAHPDISLVLRDTDLSQLPQVAAALHAPSDPAALAGVAENIAAHPVLSAHAPIVPLGWLVFVEVPLGEAFASLYGQALRSLAVLVSALIVATIAAFVLARRLTGPIRALQEGAARIGSGDLARRIDVRTGDELEGLAVEFNRMATDLEKSYGELEQRVEERTAELSEALDQQTATAEVLGVINSSPGDLAPVFDAMLEKAMRLSGALFGGLQTYDGEVFVNVAVRGGGLPVGTAVRPQPGFIMERLVRGEDFAHVTNVFDDPAYHASSAFKRMVEAGVRSVLSVALRRGGTLLGAIGIYGSDAKPFTNKQIELLQNFAAQAVIAIENARLLGEIRQRQKELRVTFDNMVDGVAMFDETLHLAAWNRNFQELLDIPDEYLSERPGFDDYIRYLTRRGEFGETDPETEIMRLRARLADHYSFERTRPDGTVIEVRHNPMPGGGIVLIYSDITERKRSEAEIRAARDAAEAAYRDLKAAQASLVQAEKMASLGQLTAGIAHEIKNPLNFVNNFAGLSVELLDELKETAAPALAALDEDKRADLDDTMAMLTGNLEKIAEHGRRADNIVKSMLEHSRGVSGERREVDLNGLVEEALNLAYHGARAQDQTFNITLERNYAPTLKPIELAPQEMTRVFLNLFGNGFYAANKRAKADGGAPYRPTLNVATCETEDGVEVKVRDNGTGIPPEIRDRLFQPFFTTKPTGEGTGLGLSISYDIVTQQHGGTITVDSQPGAFTEFTVRLPRQH